jgi:hypothetical protein
MPNSTVQLSSIVANAKQHPDLAGNVQITAGGNSLEPALTIANDVMIEILSENFNWPWNRYTLPVFYTNSFQQDYALPGVVNLGWLTDGYLQDINNTAYPQPIWPVETVKFLPRTSSQYGQPGQVCWLYNDQLTYATWGAANVGAGTGPNPQPNQAISTPLGVNSSPNNPLLQVQDAFGNLWVVTTYGVTGGSNPFASNKTPVYPTPANPTQTATTVTDGSVVWTAVNPKGMGIRCNPLPPQLGVVYQFNIFGQYRPFAFSNGPFTKLSQTIEPIPDDFSKRFRDGFVALTYPYCSDVKLRGKAEDAKNAWLASMMTARRAGDRERDNEGFYPATSILQQPFTIYPGPAYPFPLPWG